MKRIEEPRALQLRKWAELGKELMRIYAKRKREAILRGGRQAGRA